MEKRYHEKVPYILQKYIFKQQTKTYNARLAQHMMFTALYSEISWRFRVIFGSIFGVL
jgi:hypothetical protein